MSGLLREVSELTDEEAFETFRLAFGYNASDGSPSGVNNKADKVEVYSYDNKGDRTDISIFFDGKMAASGIYGYRAGGGMYSPLWDAAAVVDYLTAIGVDIRSKQ